MSKDFLANVSDRATSAGYRIASRNITRGAKFALVQAISKSDSITGEIAKAYIDTEIGSAVVSGVVGIALPNIPKIKENEHVQTISKEMQTEALAILGSSIIQELSAVLMPVIMETLASLPKEEGVRIAESSAADEDVVDLSAHVQKKATLHHT